MELQLNQTTELNHVEYRIIDGPFAGAVSDVYLARLVEVDIPVVIKLVRHDKADDAARIAGLNNEAETLGILNQSEDNRWRSLSDVISRARRAKETSLDRRIIANLDHGEIAPGKPYLVQEMAPPEFKRIPIENTVDETRTLEVALAAAQGMAVVHGLNFTLKDFEPPTKFDRFRASWDEENNLQFKLIDWNITGTPAEYSEESMLDMFYFAQYLHYMLIGRYLTLDNHKLPPTDISMGAENWEHISEGSRQILKKALQRQERLRYQRPSQIADDISWWLETLKQSQMENPAARLQDRGWNARQKREYSRLLAISHLALRLALPDDKRRTFERWKEQAQEELEKRQLAALVDGRSSLLTSAYKKAINQFQKVIDHEDEQSEVARQARLYQLLAKTGLAVQTDKNGADIRQDEAWRALELAVVQLRARKWRRAQATLAAAEKTEPTLSNFEPFNDLKNLTSAGILQEEAARKIALTGDTLPTDPDWLTEEQKKIEILKEIVSQLKEAKEAAPKEPIFEERYTAELFRLQKRENRHVAHQSIHKQMLQAQEKQRHALAMQKNENWGAAEKGFQQTLEEVDTAMAALSRLTASDSDPHDDIVARQLEELHSTAEAHHAYAQTMAAAVEKQIQADDAVRRGEYSQSDELAAAAERLSPGNARMKEILAVAEIGKRALRNIDAKLAPIRIQLNAPHSSLSELKDSRKVVDNIARLQGKAFPDLAFADTLVFPKKKREEINALQHSLHERIQTVSEEVDTAFRQAKAASSAGNYEQALKQADLVYALNPEQSGLASLQEEARAGLHVAGKIKTIVQKIERLTFRPGTGSDALQELRDGREELNRTRSWDGAPFVNIQSDIPAIKTTPLNQNFRLSEELSQSINEQNARLGREINKAVEYQSMIKALERAHNNNAVIREIEEAVQRLKSLDGQHGALVDDDYRQYLSAAHWAQLQKARGDSSQLEAVRRKLQSDPSLPVLETEIIPVLTDLGAVAELRDWRTTASRWIELCEAQPVSTENDRNKLRSNLRRGLTLFESETKLNIENSTAINITLKETTDKLQKMARIVLVSERIQDNMRVNARAEEITGVYNDLTTVRHSADSWAVMKEQGDIWYTQFIDEVVVNYLQPFIDTVKRHREDALADLSNRDEHLVPMLSAAEAGWNGLPEALQTELVKRGQIILKTAIDRMTVRQEAQTAFGVLLKEYGKTDGFNQAVEEMQTIMELSLKGLPDLYASDLEEMKKDVRLLAKLENLRNKKPAPPSYAKYIQECSEVGAKPMQQLHIEHPETNQIFMAYKSGVERRIRETEKTLYDAFNAENKKLKTELETTDPPSPKQYLTYYWQIRWLEREDKPQLNKLLQLGEKLTERLAEEARRHFGVATKSRWQKQWTEKLLLHAMILQQGLYNETDASGGPWAELPGDIESPVEKEIIAMKKLQALQQAADSFRLQIATSSLPVEQHIPAPQTEKAVSDDHGNTRGGTTK